MDRPLLVAALVAQCTHSSFGLAATVALALLNSQRTVARREGDSDFLMIGRNSRPPAVTV